MQRKSLLSLPEQMFLTQSVLLHLQKIFIKIQICQISLPLIIFKQLAFLMSQNQINGPRNMGFDQDPNPWVRIYVQDTRARRTQNGVQRFMTVRTMNTLTFDVRLITYANPMVRLTVSRDRIFKDPKLHYREMMRKIKMKRSKTGQCSICQNAIRKSTKIPKLACKHNFHRKCLFKWLESKNSCPMCREQIIS